MLDLQQGINRTILTYGQTSSGKTFTTFGNKSFPGLVPRIINQLYQYFAKISVSYIEVYQNQLYDLLNNSAPLKPNFQNNNFVTNFKQIKNDTDLFKAVNSAQRREAQTVMNERSSRSHVILQLKLES